MRFKMFSPSSNRSIVVFRIPMSGAVRSMSLLHGTLEHAQFLFHLRVGIDNLSLAGEMFTMKAAYSKMFKKLVLFYKKTLNKSRKKAYLPVCLGSFYFNKRALRDASTAGFDRNHNFFVNLCLQQSFRKMHPPQLGVPFQSECITPSISAEMGY
jgi:hypothetical protein